MLFTLKQTRLGLRNSTTRIPFKYGSACLRSCPQALLEATIEVEGHAVAGYAGDCLPPGWFDKTPGRGYRQQVADMLASIARAEALFAEGARQPISLFPAWLEAYGGVQEQGRKAGANALLATFGLSLVERAVIDALCRAGGVSFATAARQNLFAIDPGRVHGELEGLSPADWLPAAPLHSVFARHTVGLGDALTTAEVSDDERVDDGLPQAVEEYVDRLGVCYFKLKLANQFDRDRERLLAFARMVENYLGREYRLTLDGNEQYKKPEDLDALIEMLEGTPELKTLRANTIAIEQPLDRSIALDPAHTQGIRTLAKWKPVIIDESDGELDSYPRALELGYRGVSSKNCKGPLKSLLNAGLTWRRNQRETAANYYYLMTGEDLCSVGVVPVQSDLCLAVTLGLDHVERNGHHYHPGLSYLPADRQRQAFEAHPDFYGKTGSIIGPQVRAGQFEVGSLQCVGFGFDTLPDWDDWTPPGQWSFDSLGLEE